MVGPNRGDGRLGGPFMLWITLTLLLNQYTGITVCAGMKAAAEMTRPTTLTQRANHSSRKPLLATVTRKQRNAGSGVSTWACSLNCYFFFVFGACFFIRPWVSIVNRSVRSSNISISVSSKISKASRTSSFFKSG